MALAILVLVFIAIATRRFAIWQVVSVGALAMLVTLQITPREAYAAIDWKVIGFLAGMFTLGSALEESHVLTRFLERAFLPLSDRWFVIAFVFGTGILSAFFLNDTIAIIGAPAAIYLAKRRGIDHRLLLLLLCFSITTGSVFSPIGNPQNLLIAFQGDLSMPFEAFFRSLFLPTMINLAILALLFHFILKKSSQLATSKEDTALDQRLAGVIYFALLVLVSLIVCSAWIPLLYIALVPAILVLIFAPNRRVLVKKIDWQTLVFFIALFILMQGVWKHFGYKEFFTSTIDSPAKVFLSSTLLSQLVSNVPLVIFYLPLLSSPKLLLALAAGSTIAGNLLLMGAASNVIVYESAQRRKITPFSYVLFFKYGILITSINFLVYLFFIR